MKSWKNFFSFKGSPHLDTIQNCLQGLKRFVDTFITEDIILLIEKCIKDEKHAWNIFVKQFASIADNILQKFSDMELSDREDIIQNVFIKLLRGGLSNFKGTTKYEFLKYFKTIVINEAVSYLKSNKNEKSLVSLDDEQAEGISIVDMIPNDDPLSRPDVVAEEKDALDAIRRIVETFPLLDQQIFWMKLKGQKDEEIAKILHVASGTVASKYSRLKEKIKNVLEENEAL